MEKFLFNTSVAFYHLALQGLSWNVRPSVFHKGTHYTLGITDYTTESLDSPGKVSSLLTSATKWSLVNKLRYSSSNEYLPKNVVAQMKWIVKCNAIEIDSEISFKLMKSFLREVDLWLTDIPRDSGSTSRDARCKSLSAFIFLILSSLSALARLWRALHISYLDSIYLVFMRAQQVPYGNTKTLDQLTSRKKSFWRLFMKPCWTFYDLGDLIWNSQSDIE